MSEVVDNPKFKYENFITDKMTNFWNKVSNKDGIEVILNIYIEMNTILLKKLYQLSSEMSLEDIVPFNIRSGMIINLDKREPTYTKIEVPSDDKEYIKNIPNVYSNVRYPKIKYEAGEDYEVIRENNTTYIDFSKGNPEILRTDETGVEDNPYIYFPVAYTEDKRIYKNYGKAVGLQPETIDGIEGQEDEFYRNGVQALWKAMYTGPTISSLRQAMYVLHGLPINREAGVIEEIDRIPVFETGEPSITVNGKLGRDHFDLHLHQDNIVNIDDSGVNTFVGYNVSSENIKKFTKIHQVNLIDENMIDHEDVYKRKLDKSLFYYDEANKIFYVEESLVESGLSVTVDGNYEINENYNILINDTTSDASIEKRNSLKNQWIRVFYNHRKQGERRQYNLPGSLSIYDDMSEGDFVSKFSLFTEQLEIRDYAADGSTRGEQPGKKDWLKNLFPFGRFSVQSGKELDTKTVIDNVNDFLDFLKPVYSNYSFQLQLNPANAHALGRIENDSIVIEMIKETDKRVINFGGIGELTANIYNSITFTGDQEHETGFDPIPMWDQKEYYDTLISDIQDGNIEFEDDFYTNDTSEDSHVMHIYNSGFYKDLQFWDRGVVEAETKSQAQDLADDLAHVTWEEIYYPPEHDLGKLVVDKSENMAWDLGHIEGDELVAWDDKSINFDQGVDSSDKDEVLPDYDSNQVEWQWDQNNIDDVVANRSPFTYIFDGDKQNIGDSGPILPGLWDDINIFYDLRELFLNK